MTKKLLEIAADIVQAQASVGHMSPQDIETVLTRTFTTLQKMQKAEDTGTIMPFAPGAEPAQEELEKPMSPQDSIKEDKIICLECGLEARQLTANHLKAHDLTPREYKKKYGMPQRQPLSAKALTRARSKAAKKRGIPENLAKHIEARRKKAESLAFGEDTVASIEPQVEQVVMVSEVKEQDVVSKKPAKKGNGRRGPRKKGSTATTAE